MTNTIENTNTKENTQIFDCLKENLQESILALTNESEKHAFISAASILLNKEYFVGYISRSISDIVSKGAPSDWEEFELEMDDSDSDITIEKLYDQVIECLAKAKLEKVRGPDKEIDTELEQK